MSLYINPFETMAKQHDKTNTFAAQYSDTIRQIMVYEKLFHGISADEKAELLHSIAKVQKLWTDPAAQIGDYFTYISRGSFKAVYELSEHYVIKFTNVNDTIKEKYVYEAAVAEGLEKIFAPSWYIEAGQYAVFNERPDLEDPDCIWCSDDGDSIWKDGFNMIVIQRKVDLIVDDTTVTETDTEEEYFGDFWTNINWMETVKTNYGEEFQYRFIGFCNKFFVEDLHSQNIGYCCAPDGTMLPVILDFLSDK